MTHGAATAPCRRVPWRRWRRWWGRAGPGRAGAAFVLRLYEERAAEPGLAELLRRGPRCPSLADALEGLRDAQRSYRHLRPPVAGLPGQGWGCVQGGVFGDKWKMSNRGLKTLCAVLLSAVFAFIAPVR